MSTRGFLTIIDEQKNIQMAAFVPSAAYPSYLGTQVLDAIEKCEFPQFINEVRHNYPEEEDMIQGIRRDWYIRGKDNKDEFFHDYAYELNGTKQELTIYHYGDKALSIPYDQIPLYRFVFENDNQLYYPLSLDERSMTLKKDFYKEVRTMVKDGADIDAFRKVIDSNPSVLYLDFGRIKDSWNFNNESFNKKVEDSAGGSLMFCASEGYTKNFQLYVQTPFVRAPISHRTLPSATAVERYLAELVRDRPDDVRATIDMFGQLEAYSANIKHIYADDKADLGARADKAQAAKLDMLATFKAATAEHRILGNTDNLLEREINEVCHRHYRHAREKLEKQEEKASFSDKLQDATLRAGSVSAPETAISVPER